ncbi:MAG: succinylglutamate desuccinylase/aspartoacylase family protein [Myxococcota bacterium]
MLKDLLGRFAALRAPGPYEGRWIHHHPASTHDFHIVFGVMTHGDEVGPLPAALRLMAELADGTTPYGGAVTVTIGNPEAGLKGRRFLEDDLNRVFIEGPPSHERRRAREMMAALDDCHLFIDLHQTGVPSLAAFWTLPWSEPAWHWIRIAGDGDVWTTRAPGGSFAEGRRCGDEYVRDRGLPGLTLELGLKGFTHEAEARAYSAMTRTLAAAEHLAKGDELAALASTRPDARFLVTAHKEPFGDPARTLRPGLRYFEPVVAGQELQDPASGPKVVVPMDGFLLFPKYPARNAKGVAIEPVPTDLFHVTQEAPEHPTTLFAR